MIKRLVGVAIGMAAGLAISGGCRSKVAGPAPTSEADASNPHIHQAWLANLGIKNDKLEAIHLTPDRVFVYSDNNQVYVLNRFGGTVEWATQIGESYTSVLPPLVTADRVAFPVSTRLFIYDNHGIQDRVQDIGFAMHAPGVTDGQKMMYIPAAREMGARLAAVDVTKRVGAISWEFLTGGPITAAPAMYENLIFVGAEDNRVYAVTTRRAPVWSLDQFAFQTAGRIAADVKVDDYAVYAASTDTKLYALDRQNGHIKWTFYAQAPLSTPPAVTKDTVYQYIPGRGLAAVNKTEGSFNREARWVAPDAKQVLSAGAKRVYVRLRDDTIGALDKQTGEILSRGSRKYSAFTTNTQDATVMAATSDGHVYAFQPTGEAAPVRPAAVKPATKPAATSATPAAAPAQPVTPQPAAP